jgi:hypothetical protein
MSLKLLLLKNGDELVSDVKSVKDEDGKKVYSYILTNPMKLETEGDDDDDFLLEGDEDYQVARVNEYEEELTLSMTRWPRFTEQDKIYLSPEWVVTLVDPISQLAEMYKNYEKNHGNEEESGPVHLTEESGSGTDLQG